MNKRKMLLLTLIILLILPMTGCNYEGAGDKFYKQGKYEWALKAYQKALDNELSKPYGAPEVIYFKMGACYEMMRNPGRAIDMYKMVIKTNPLGKLSLQAGKAILRCKAQQWTGNPPNVGGGNNIPQGGSIFDQIGNAINGVVNDATNKLNDAIGGGNNSGGYNSGGYTQPNYSNSGDAARIRQKIQALQSKYNRYIDRGDLVRAQNVFKEIQVLQDQLKRIR